MDFYSRFLCLPGDEQSGQMDEDDQGSQKVLHTSRQEQVTSAHFTLRLHLMVICWVLDISPSGFPANLKAGYLTIIDKKILSTLNSSFVL